MNAYKNLIDFLREDEHVINIVFGDYGQNNIGFEFEDYDSLPIKKELKGKLLTLEEAKPLMESWSFCKGFGTVECYAVYIWTNKRVIWVSQYDGSTWLSSAPRDPIVCIPKISGG
jgi:hypothetical protein